MAKSKEQQVVESGPVADGSPPASSSTHEQESSDVRQYVTFMSGDEVFAVDLTPVQEIIRVPDVVRVPLAPASLDGLANLRGTVLPILSLRRIFGFVERPLDDASRALVIDLGQPLGFVVDKVASVVGVEFSKLESVDSIKGTVNSELLSGIIKDVNGHAMIMVLDFAKLISREFADLASLSGHATGANGLPQRPDLDTDAVSDERHLVSFGVAAQEYAIAIEDVKEIVQVPEQIVRVPHAESHVLGVMTLRNRLLPLVSLRQMFALPDQDANERSRVVVVALAGASVGIVVDSVHEVLRVPVGVVDVMPNLFSRTGTMSEIAEICRLDDGKRLVSIITTVNLFRHAAVKEAMSTVDEMRGTEDHEDETDASSDDDEQVVVFRLDKEEFGVPIYSVQEIVRVPDTLTHVPKAPSFVEGVINLRGSVLPVIDLRRRLGLGSLERSDRQRIMVFLIEGTSTGFIVDSVAEVLRIPKSSITTAPKLSSEQGELLSRMANLEKQHRMVQLLTPRHLLGTAELTSLAAVAA